MNNISNRQAICDILIQRAKTDKDIIVLCSDSRGSASLDKFADAYPDQFVEVGIAEQNLVSIAAGLASCGKKPFAASPACFLCTRSLEQVKVDVAYSAQNVKLIGISGGISYGALGMTHHSTQDIAAIAAIPGMRVYLPSDRFQTVMLMEMLLKDDRPAYVRIGRNPVQDVYDEIHIPFEMNRATLLQDGCDVTIIACGEMVYPAKLAALALKEKEISCRLLDMYCVKPVDKDSVVKAVLETRGIITIEEHSYFGGLGSMVSQIAAELGSVRVKSLALPDEPVIAGKSAEVFNFYGLNTDGLIKAVEDVLK